MSRSGKNINLRPVAEYARLYENISGSAVRGKLKIRNTFKRLLHRPTRRGHVDRMNEDR